MSHPGEIVVASLPRARAQVVADLFSLAKPRVVLMVLITTVVGYYVGLAGAPDYARLLALLIGTSLAQEHTLPACCAATEWVVQPRRSGLHS